MQLFVVLLFSFFLSRPLLKSFDSLWLYFSNKVTTYSLHFLSLIRKIILSLSVLPTDKTKCLVYLSFNSIAQLINEISSDLQKLPKYFNDTVIVTFCRASFTWFRLGWVTVSPYDSALYLKDLELSPLATLTEQLVSSSFK